MSRLRDAARGVLLGQAVGDALGTTVEFCTKERVAQVMGVNGWPRDIIGGGPFEVRAGQVTDDTEMALALARTLVRVGRYDEDEVARGYVAWLASGPRDFGRATHRAFRNEGVPERAVAAFVEQRADPLTQANGSLMRASPLGVFGYELEPQELARLAARDSRLSHPQGVCQAACAVFTATIAQVLRTGCGASAAFEWAVQFASSETWLEPVSGWLEEAREQAPRFSMEHQGWVKVTFESAFFQLAHFESFEASLVEVVRGGGDTDTNAAVTGALLGAVVGEAGVPERWRRVVLECEAERPREYQCGDLRELAVALLGE